MIGDKSVVTRTMMTTGAKKTSDNNPTEIPFCATISATSPRHTIPAPICTDSLFVYLHNNAPKVKIRTIAIQIKLPTTATAIDTKIPMIFASSIFAWGFSFFLFEETYNLNKKEKKL